MSINTFSLFFSFSKNWYDYHEFRNTDSNLIEQKLDTNQQESDNFPKEYYRTTQLTIASTFSPQSNPSFIENIRPVFVGTCFTDLHINCRYMPIGMLTNLIGQLPKLDSLVFPSLMFLQREYISVGYRKVIRSLSNRIKITKVKFVWENQDRETELAHIQFLIELCPSVRLMEIKFENCPNPNDLVQYILIKRVSYIHQDRKSVV